MKIDRKRIKKKLKAKRNHIDVAKVQSLADNFREDFLEKEDVLKFLGSENFSNLVDVAKYADFGVSTAIQAAFCMGYEAGKAGRNSDKK